MRKDIDEKHNDAPPFVFAPTCPDCDRKMRLRTIEHFRGAEIRLYRCKCGVAFSQTLNWEGAADGENLVVAQFRPG
jgi:hypothetical protein